MAIQVRKPTDDERKKASAWPVFPRGLECTWVVRKPVRKHYNFG